MGSVPFETFAALDAPFCVHAFTQRVPGLDVEVDRQTALERLEPYYAQVRARLGLPEYAVGEQVHGCEIAVIEAGAPGGPRDHSLSGMGQLGPMVGVDGLVTNRPGLCLGVLVADCCAVYLVDPVRRCIGLVHSGKKGTDLGIVPKAIAKMESVFGTDPADLLVQLAPCIRPPFYETDFAQEIVRQCQAAGVRQLFDCGANTGGDLARYYSYRVEKGKTGRMLALLGLKK